MKLIQSLLLGDLINSNSIDAFSLQQKSFLGEKIDNKIQYSIAEAYYLVDKNKMEVLDGKGKPITKENLKRKFQKMDRKFKTKYPVFKDLRDKGYIVKTALKFGAEFRVYPKGSKPGGKHSKWIVFTDSESGNINWHDFSSKNRVAHSTKKNLLLAIVDEESDVTYYEVKWTKP
jgi:tRNA-intron endonuclease